MSNGLTATLLLLDVSEILAGVLMLSTIVETILRYSLGRGMPLLVSKEVLLFY